MGYQGERDQLIYVLENEDTKRIKIGITRDLHTRINSIKMASGCNIRLLYETEVLINAEYVEGLIHSRLSDKRHLGEWFTISKGDAISAVCFMVDKHGVPNKSHSNKKLIKEDVDGYNYRESINFFNYKRVKPCIYSDNAGGFYFIKYISGKGWIVNRLEKID